jgi:hypothetical protein
MADDARGLGWVKLSLTLAAGLMLLVVLYVASTGPVVAVVNHYGAPDWLENALEVIYAPLIMLDRAWPPAEAFFEWYFGIWRDLLNIK